MTAPIKKIVVIFLLALGLSSCAPVIKFEQPVRTDFVFLENGSSLGQTFLGRYAGMEGVAIFMKPGTPGDGTLRLDIRSGPTDQSSLATATMPLAQVSSPGFYRFQFPPLQESNQRDYFLSLETEGAGAVQVGTAPGEAYLNGAFYQDQNPQDFQLTFRLAYNATQALAGLVGEGLSWFGWIALTLFLFVIPGWALLSLLWPSWNLLGWPDKLGLAGGLSLALYPLLFLYTDLINLRLGSLYAWLPPVAGLLVIAWRNRKALDLLLRPVSYRLSFIPYAPAAIRWRDLTLFAVLALVFGVRFWTIRGLDAPMWGDAYQHAMIAQLLLDNGGLFDSWEPYIPYHSLTVHYGFSSLVAVFSWLAKSAVAPATLLTGQILNGLAVLTLYPLARRIANGNHWAGIGAVLVAGLLSPMPAHYVNWGRYAQLAGQAVLPVAVWLLWDAISPLKAGANDKNASLEKPNTRLRLHWPRLFIAGAALTGMMLSYYRMPFYYTAFVLVWLVGWGLPTWRLDFRRWLRAVAGLLVIGGTAILLFLPWLRRLSGGNLSQALETGVTVSSPLEYVVTDYQAWLALDFFLPRFLLLPALIAIVWSIKQKRWLVACLVLWVGLLSAYVGGQLIRLPGANMMQNFAVLIALYVPAGLLIGWLFGEIAEYVTRRNQLFGQIALALVVVSLAAWGVWLQRGTARPAAFAYVTRPDLRAMDWIRENTSPEARFLVEGYRIYNGKSVVGADAGWWIPLLAKRQNTLPPQYALLNEVPIPGDYTQNVVDLVARLETVSPASPAGLQWLCEQNITHVYIGQRQGLVGDSVRQLFKPEDFHRNPGFELLYQQDRVAIFGIQDGQCPARNESTRND